MSRIRAVFLGTPEIARYCLEAMIRDTHFEVVGVVSQPDRPAGRKMQLQPSPVKALVQGTAIPVLTPENVNTPEVLQEVASWKAEVAVVVAFGQILSQKFLDLFPQKVVNVHGSLLPRWRGAAPIQRALMAGDKETGVSLQIVVKKMDAGPILGLRRIPLDEGVDAAWLYARMSELGSDLIAVELMDYLRGNLTPLSQDKEQATFAPKIEKTESEINWSLPAEVIHNRIRGLVMGPVAQTRRSGQIVKVLRSKAHLQSHALRPGQVLEVSEKHLRLACGQGSLELLEVQPESRSRMKIEDYLRGYPAKTGEVWGDVPQETSQGDI